jgi:hypothetical protein
MDVENVYMLREGQRVYNGIKTRRAMIKLHVPKPCASNTVSSGPVSKRLPIP